MTDFVLAVLTIAAVVYGTSAAAKLRGRSAYRSFRAGLAGTALVPPRYLAANAAALVSGEIITAGLAVAALLVTTLMPDADAIADSALAAAVLLTCVLAAGVAVIVRRGTVARCACFGAAAGIQLGLPHLARNLALLGVLTAGLISSLLGPGRPGLAGAVVALAAGAVAGLVLTRFDELIMLFMPPSSARPGPSGSGPSLARGRAAGIDGRPR
jgi:hypothetical protein